MGPISAIQTGFAKVLNVKERASRPEFWWFFLTAMTLQTAALAYDLMAIAPLFITQDYKGMTQLSIFDFASVYAVMLMCVPMTTLQIRRLHDAGFSGFWIVLAIVPFGIFALMVLYLQPTASDTNIWGTPATGGSTTTRKPITQDAEARAMQGYACLFELNREPTPETVAARKAEISAYYRDRVLNAGQAI